MARALCALELLSFSRAAQMLPAKCIGPSGRKERGPQDDKLDTRCRQKRSRLLLLAGDESQAHVVGGPASALVAEYGA
jgi:hypothetical protein